MRSNYLPFLVVTSSTLAFTLSCKTDNYDEDKYENWITDMAVSTDGKVLVSSDDDGMICFWNTEYLQKIGEKRLTDSILTAVAFSPVSSSIACSSLDGMIWYFDGSTKTIPEPIIRMPKGVLDLCFSPDGETIYFVGRDQCLHAFNLRTKASAYVKGVGERWIESIAIDSNGELIATGDWGGNVAVWDAKKLELIANWNVQPFTIRTLEFVPESTKIAVGSHKLLALTIWDYASRSMLHQLYGEDSIGKLQVLGQNQLVAGGTDGWLRLWNVESGEQLGSIKANLGWVSAIAMDSKCSIIYTGSMEGQVKKWNLTQLKNSKQN